MGLFNIGCLIANHQDRARSVRVPKIMVDTGSELTWINQKHLEKIGVAREEKELRLKTVDGREIIRPIGFAIICVGKEITTDEVVFAQKGDLQLLGARTLEGLNLKVDLRNKKLVGAGPIAAAGNIIQRDKLSSFSHHIATVPFEMLNQGSSFQTRIATS